MLSLRYLGLLAGCVMVAVPICVSAAAPSPVASSYTLKLSQFALLFTSENGMQIDHAGDNSGEVYLVSQSGKIRRFSSTGGSLGVFLDIPAVLPQFTYPNLPASFRGLMYTAFHPDYARAGEPGYGKFYTVHEMVENDALTTYHSVNFGAPFAAADKQFVIGEWTANPLTRTVNTSSYRQVMRLGFQTESASIPNPHGLGQIKFDPFAKPGDADYGNLYVMVGDSNSGNGVAGNIDLQMVQNLDNPFGKILRINPLAANGKPYQIPADNPYHDGGPLLDNDGRAEEIYAVGFRDPQTLNFGRDAQGRPVLVSYDIGAGGAEELNLIHAGANYGWPRLEGTDFFDFTKTLSGPPIAPAAMYNHGSWPAYPGGPAIGGGAAVVGGAIVSDPLDPTFQKQVIYTDLVRGAMFHSDYSALLAAETSGVPAPVQTMTVAWNNQLGSFASTVGASRGDVRFGTDQANNLYLVSKQTGRIFRTGLVANTLIGGDYNNDGAVDAADYTVWRDRLATGGVLLNETASPGTIDAADYQVWLTQFASASAAASSVTVPEPNAVAVIAVLLLIARWRSRQAWLFHPPCNN